MRNSNLLKMKWAQNNKNNKLTNGSEKAKKWVHSNETLLKGHVVYLVKFLGSTEVDQPKGIEVVKQGIQKLKFNQQLKKSEGVKTPKVELTLSVDGVAIQEPKSKKILHQYPLHKISYCADDKAEKRFFSFIAKEGDTNKHTCFVFVSDKLAEEITLTIGQAFELAYKKFLETSNKEMEVKKQLLVLQKRIAILENENTELKKRLTDVADIKGRKDVNEYCIRNGIKDLTLVRDPGDDNAASASGSDSGNEDGSKSPSGSLEEEADGGQSSTANDDLICIETEVKLEGFDLEDLNDEDFNPRDEDDDSNAFNPRSKDDIMNQFHNSISAPQLASSAQQSHIFSTPPPALPPRDPSKIQPPPSQNQFGTTSAFSSPSAGFGNNNSNAASSTAAKDAFAKSVATNPFATDPFGMSAFDSNAASSQPASAFNAKTNHDALIGFQSGLTMGTMGTNFSLDELDPLKN